MMTRFDASLRVYAALGALSLAVVTNADAQGNSKEQARVFEHENETPAAQKDAREAARKGEPDVKTGKPGGAYPVPDSASSSGTPAQAK